MSSEQEYREYVHPYYYGIKASWALAVAATFLFACVTVTHLVLLCLKRAWFLIPLLFGALCAFHCKEGFIRSLPAHLPQHIRLLTLSSVETIGYAFRAAGVQQNVPNPTTYVTSSTFIIIAPAFVAASLYQLLAHIIVANGRGGSKIVLKLGTGLGFAALDILSYALQAAGKQLFFHH